MKNKKTFLLLQMLLPSLSSVENNYYSYIVYLFSNRNVTKSLKEESDRISMDCKLKLHFIVV